MCLKENDRPGFSLGLFRGCVGCGFRMDSPRIVAAHLKCLRRRVTIPLELHEYSVQSPHLFEWAEEIGGISSVYYFSSDCLFLHSYVRLIALFPCCISSFTLFARAKCTDGYRTRSQTSKSVHTAFHVNRPLIRFFAPVRVVVF